MSFSNVFDFAGQLYKKALLVHTTGMLLLTVVIILLMFIGIPLLMSFHYEEMLINAKDNPFYVAELMSSPLMLAKISLMSLVVGVLVAPLSAGFYQNLDAIAKGGQSDFANLFMHYNSPYTGRIMLSTLILGVVNGGISILMNVVGIPLLDSLLSFFINIVFCLSLPIIIFENQSVTDALKGSYERVIASFGTVLGVLLVAFLIAVLGVLACCVGLFFTVPFLYAATYAIYDACKAKPKVSEY